MRALGLAQGLAASARARATWAKYLSKWVTAYEGQGVSLWGLTVQNEPEFAAPWEACQYNASFEAAFVREFLGPTLRADHPGLKIMAFDHNKDHLEAWTEAMFPAPSLDSAPGASVPAAAAAAATVALDGEVVSTQGAGGFVDGMAFHWYAGGVDRLQDGTFGYHFVARAAELLAETSGGAGRGDHGPAASSGTAAAAAADEAPFLLPTEGCNCPGAEAAGSALSWLRSERYAHDILQDLNNYASGWVDWNLLLDHAGGPNHLGNVCDAPILATADHSDVVVQPYLFAIGHFSKFFVPGTRVVASGVQANFAAAGRGGAGGVAFGGHSRAVSGAALALWPCDASSRQRFAFDHGGDGKLKLADSEPRCKKPSRPAPHVKREREASGSGGCGGVVRRVEGVSAEGVSAEEVSSAALALTETPLEFHPPWHLCAASLEQVQRRAGFRRATSLRRRPHCGGPARAVRIQRQ